jgi:hypothetical protein
MEKVKLPCCNLTDARRVKELPHVYGFDFDLFQCGRCGRYWAYAWCTATSVGDWEEVTATDAQEMQARDGDGLRSFMRQWAQPFN